MWTSKSVLLVLFVLFSTALAQETAEHEQPVVTETTAELQSPQEEGPEPEEDDEESDEEHSEMPSSEGVIHESQHVVEQEGHGGEVPDDDHDPNDYNYRVEGDEEYAQDGDEDEGDEESDDDEGEADIQYGEHPSAQSLAHAEEEEAQQTASGAGSLFWILGLAPVAVVGVVAAHKGGYVDVMQLKAKISETFSGDSYGQLHAVPQCSIPSAEEESQWLEEEAYENTALTGYQVTGDLQV